MNENASLIGSRLRNIREEKRLGSLISLANKLGVSNNTLAKYELGTVLPDIDFLMLFCDVTQASFVELLNLRVQSSSVFSDNLDKKNMYLLNTSEILNRKFNHENLGDGHISGEIHSDGTYVIETLLLICREVCASVYGASFEKEPINIQITHALDLHRHVVNIANSIGCSLNEIRTLEAKDIESQLRFLIKTNKAKRFISPFSYDSFAPNVDSVMF